MAVRVVQIDSDMFLVEDTETGEQKKLEWEKVGREIRAGRLALIGDRIYIKNDVEAVDLLSFEAEEAIRKAKLKLN